MHQSIGRHLKHQGLLLLLALLICWLLDSVAWVMVMVLAALLFWNSWQLYRLIRWMRHSERDQAPESYGVWGQVFDEMHGALDRHRRVEAQLRQVIGRGQESTAALREAVVMVDSQGELEWWNQSAQRLLGLKRPEDNGQPITNLIRDPQFIRYLAQRQFQEPLELPSPINNRVQLQFTVTEFGRSERLLLVRDVTRMHQLERMRQDFVGNASHELRTPLTVIRGYLETLQDQFADQHPVLIRAFKQMEAQALRMENLVTDMLMLSRLETTDRVVDELPIDVGRMLREVREDASTLSIDKSVQVNLDVDERYLLLGQEKELFSAFSNLATNAVKFTEQGQVDIRWWVDEKGGHYEVSDTGVGIEQHHLQRLAERFYRVDDGRSRSEGGTGLGLAIVKHVMMRHASTLEVDSQLGKGTCFRCHFPPSRVQLKQLDSCDSESA
jgi:two-component system phosphate regulon sensor histidine kinase PhoR